MTSLCVTLLLSVAAWTGASVAQNLDVVSPQKKVTLSLNEMKAKLKTYTVKIDDPLYKKSKEYDAFLLQDIFRLAGLEPSTVADELIFTAVDSYAPSMPFSKLTAHKGYLAYQEHATPGRFAMLNQGKTMVSPWPFYVIWEEGQQLKESLPWPYQLVKIEAVDWKSKYPLVAPPKAAVESDEMKGFSLFKDHCIRCHSVNLEGGEIGPELNVPQNITEYWKADALKGLIKNVSKFRLKSKMPVFDELSEGDVDHIVSYLRVMKGHKIKTP